MKLLRLLIIPVCIITLAWHMSSCGSSGKTGFCDTACITDTLRYVQAHPDTPFVLLSVKNCQPDTFIWSHKGLDTKRKMGFYELVGKDVRLNKDFISCYFNDTSYAWLKFNDCITGRGFLVKLPYSKNDKWSIYTSALNSFDKKFHVEDGLIAYYDETFIYAQDQATGKLDRMLMNNTGMDIDHNDIHSTFDSVNITRNKIWAKIKIKGQFTPKEKQIALK